MVCLGPNSLSIRELLSFLINVLLIDTETEMELSESEDDELVELKRQYLRMKLQLVAKRKSRKRRERKLRRKRRRGNIILTNHLTLSVLCSHTHVCVQHTDVSQDYASFLIFHIGPLLKEIFTKT